LLPSRTKDETTLFVPEAPATQFSPEKDADCAMLSSCSCSWSSSCWIFVLSTPFSVAATILALMSLTTSSALSMAE